MKLIGIFETQNKIPNGCNVQILKLPYNEHEFYVISS